MNSTMAMQNSAHKLLLAALASFTFAVAGNVFAAAAGEVSNLSGTLSVRHADGTSKLLAVKSEVQPGDTLATEAGTYARVKFIDGGEVVMRPGTRVKIDAFSYDQAKPAADNQVISLLKGGFRAITGFLGKRSREKVSYVTPTATIGIRGTNVGAQLEDDNSLYVDVSEGAVVVTSKKGQVEVKAGQFAFVKDGDTVPTLILDGKKVEVPDEIGDGVGWANGPSCSM